MASFNGFKNGVRKYGIWLIFAIGSLILLIASLRKKSVPPPVISEGQIRIPGNQPIPPNPEIDVILTSNGYSPDMARWWSAISKLETGNYTSELFRNANNLFGMGVPTVRRSLRSGTYEASDAGNRREFSAYRSTADSVSDLVLYLQSLSYPTTFSSVDALVAFMKAPNGNKKLAYFEIPYSTYLAGVKRYL